MLAKVTLTFVATMLLHGADHFRQGTERLTAEVLWGGTWLFAVAAVTLWLVLRGDARAPLVATVVGFWTVVGVSASHLLPHWSAFSDPYADLSLDVLSWAAMLSEIVLALALGLIGLRELRRSRPALAPPGVR